MTTTCGPEAAGAATADRFAATLGDRAWLDAHAVRHGYDLAAAPLPRAQLIVPYDPGELALEQWPAVLINVTGTTSMKPVDVDDDGSRRFLTTYTVRLLLLVRADDERATELLRKQYVLAAREALLANQSDLAVVEPSLREDYSALVAADGGSVTALAAIDVQIRLNETIPGPGVLGEADTIGVAVTAWPQMSL